MNSTDLTMATIAKREFDYSFVIRKEVVSFGQVTARFFKGDQAYPFNELLFFEPHFFVMPQNGRGSIAFHPANAYSVSNQLWSH